MEVLENEVTNNIVNNNLFENAGGLQLNYKFLNVFSSEVSIFDAGLNVNINIIKSDNNGDNNEDYKGEEDENIKK